MKRNPRNHKNRFDRWKTSSGIIEDVSKYNSDLIVEFLNDMQKGYNTARRRPVQYARLNNLRQRLTWIVMQIEKIYKKDKVTDITSKEIVDFFNFKMRNGEIKTNKGKSYISVDSYVQVFISFWHWYQRREEGEDRVVKDITKYLDRSPVQDSSFVYFDISNLKRMIEQSKYEYRVLMWFLFDTGIRAPTELINIKVEDLYEIDNSGVYELDIRGEISKTFGRKIKLLLCSPMLKDYLKTKDLKRDDYLFDIEPRVVNQYLKRIAKKVLGDVKTKGGNYSSELTLYDFRHSSACYWVSRYKSDGALKYRFGWKTDNMIHHYTKLLGMKDTIAEQDLMDTDAKSKLEQELQKAKQKQDIMAEQMEAQRKQMEKMQTMFMKTLAAIDTSSAKQKLSPDMVKQFLEADN